MALVAEKSELWYTIFTKISQLELASLAENNK
jgi:hypothetical protein